MLDGEPGENENAGRSLLGGRKAGRNSGEDEFYMTDEVELWLRSGHPKSSPKRERVLAISPAAVGGLTLTLHH